jgi:hypothetical protein
MSDKTAMEIKREKIILDYVKATKRLKDYPKLVDLTYTRHEIKYCFKHKDNLRKIAEERYPDAFKNLIDYEIFSDSRQNELRKEIKKYKRFVITTAVSHHAVNKSFLDSLKSYCKINKAKLLILIAANDLSGFVDETLINESIVYGDKDIQLNNNLFISTIKILPKQINPTTGLQRYATGNGTMIFASPKQYIEYSPLANKEHSLPRALVTTGAVTLPGYEYENRRYDQQRTSTIAKLDHNMGAIVVEIENKKLFHFRPVEMCTNGGFIDLGKFYSPDGDVQPISASAIVYGDIHAGEVDKGALKCFENLNKRVNAKIAVLHDVFSGISINPHEKDNMISRVQKIVNGKHLLHKELIEYTEQLNYFSKLYDKIYIIRSNHDKFLDRYVTSTRFIEDDYNTHIGSVISAVLTSPENKNLNINPLEWFSKNHETSKLNNPNKFVWTVEDKCIDIEGYNVNMHGNNGSNGSKGSLKNLEKTTEKLVIGHSHTPMKLRNAIQVGTCSILNPEYTKGPSSWVHASCVIYPGGTMQLINSIEGKFTTFK